jgi:hypothetical protein
MARQNRRDILDPNEVGAYHAERVIGAIHLAIASRLRRL